MSGGKPSPAKKRKAGAAAAAAGSKKLSAGVGALLARLEATNAGFLQASAEQAVAQQLKAAQSAAARLAAAEAAAKATSPSLASLPVDGAELARRAERRARFQVRCRGLGACPAPCSLQCGASNLRPCIAPYPAAASRPTTPPCLPAAAQEEKAAAAAAAGIRDREKTLVELRSEQGVARGQNQSLEKEYLRLTSLPRRVHLVVLAPPPAPGAERLRAQPPNRRCPGVRLPAQRCCCAHPNRRHADASELPILTHPHLAAQRR